MDRALEPRFSKIAKDRSANRFFTRTCSQERDRTWGKELVESIMAHLI